MKFWVSGGFVVISLVSLVACLPVEEADRVIQGLRDVVTDHGKDYRYSAEDGQSTESYAKVKRSVEVQDPLTKDDPRPTSSLETSIEYEDDGSSQEDSNDAAQNDANGYLTDETSSSQENNGDNGEDPTSPLVQITTNEAIGNEGGNAESTLEKPPTGRSKRQTDELEAYRDKMLEQLNQHREDHSLPLFVVSYSLEAGAQEWAEEESRAFAMSHSCENCHDYSEILARRRSSRPLPQGVEAGEWVYQSLFGDDDDKTYATITDDVDIHTVGFGIAFVRNPDDRTYHAYVVARFARRIEIMK